MRTGLKQLQHKAQMEQPIYTLPDRKQLSLIARRYYSGFEQAHDTYNAISAASDGKIYYVLSSASTK